MSTIREFLQELWPEAGAECAVWPPDVFAICIALLHRTGAYRHVVSDWKPHSGAADWFDTVEKAASSWRSQAVTGPVPEYVRLRWRTVWRARNKALDSVGDLPALTKALLEICSIADQASANAGIPLGETAVADPFDFEAAKLLSGEGATLGRSINASRVRVLPKLHTPQTGLTVRSLSHHLAVYRPGDLEVAWHNVPTSRLLHSLNLLLVPWPLKIRPSQFTEVAQDAVRLAPGFGFFRFTSDAVPRSAQRIRRLIAAAQSMVRRVDGVILPELSVPRRTYTALRRAVLEKGCFLVAGVQEPESLVRHMGANCVRVDIPAAEGFFESSSQDKHHRWRIMGPQIVQYGIGSALDPRTQWWEWMPIERRRLSFFAMRPWLTMCALICEDLARQEPAGEVVRAVGPNLVLALLMDGPQLRERWAARYATVLADDPGSSVLTLTSLGMSVLSRPAGKEPSRVVGLWKDALSGDAIPLTLPDGAEALVLSLAVDYRNEWTADGRSDGGATGYPTFAGMHGVWPD